MSPLAYTRWPSQKLLLFRQYAATHSDRETATFFNISKAVVNKYRRLLGITHDQSTIDRLIDKNKKATTAFYQSDRAREKIDRTVKVIRTLLDKERRRMRLALPQQTNYHLTEQSHPQRRRVSQAKHRLRQYGYITEVFSDVIRYDSSTTRKASLEASHHQRYGFHFVHVDSELYIPVKVEY